MRRACPRLRAGPRRSAFDSLFATMMLPDAEHAHVPLEKLAGYGLDATHPTGKHKARVFASALGLTAVDADWLRDRILDAVRTTEATEGEETEHGRRYVVDFALSTRAGAAVVHTAWMIRHSETFPRLTSCYVL